MFVRLIHIAIRRLLNIFSPVHISGVLNCRFLLSAEVFIERFCMTGGNSPIGYLKAYHTNLYLSADPAKVREALEEGQCGEKLRITDKL